MLPCLGDYHWLQTRQLLRLRAAPHLSCDRRARKGRLDLVNFNLLSPYTIDKMVRGVDVLEKLKALSGATSDTYAYQSARITNVALEKGLRF